MNWSSQRQLNYLISLEKKEVLTDKDIILISTFSKEQDRSILSKDEEISIKSEVASQLVRFESEFCKNVLLNLTYDENVLVRVEACDSLCIYNDKEVFNRLLELSTKDRCLVRNYAVMSMADVAVNGDFNINKTIELLWINLLREKSKRVKMGYYYAFCVLGNREYYDVILQHLSHNTCQIRCVAINNLLELVEEDEYDKTLQCLIDCEKNEKDTVVRNSLSKAINHIKSRMN